MGDLTSEAIIPEDQLSTRDVPLQGGRGSSPAWMSPALVFRLVDSSSRSSPRCGTARRCRAGMVLGSLHGSATRDPAGRTHRAEHPAADERHRDPHPQYVNAVAGTGARITDTRKTVPGLRVLDKWAVRGRRRREPPVRAGRHGPDQGQPYRGRRRHHGCREALQAYLEERDITVAIEVETTTLDEVREALACPGIARIMLDNFRVDECAKRSG